MRDRHPAIARQVTQAARNLRSAIEMLPRRHRGDLLDGFPKSCCKPASQLLARYLVTIARVPMVQFVSARRHGEPWCKGWQSHVWLEAGGMSVDITADQYSEARDPFIVSAASRWHDTFQTQARLPYSEMMRMNPADEKRFNRVYTRLMADMDVPPAHRPSRIVMASASMDRRARSLRSAAVKVPTAIASLGNSVVRRRVVRPAGSD